MAGKKYKFQFAKEKNQATSDFERGFYKLLNNAFYGKTMENVKNGIGVIPIKKDEDDKNFKWQSKQTFNGIHKSYENNVTYTLKQTEVLMGKPTYSGFTVLELSEIILYET